MLRVFCLVLLLMLPGLAQDGENSYWEKKLAIMPAGTVSAAPAPPDIPSDPNPSKVGTTGNVFKDPQLYVRFVMGPQGIDWSRTSTRWYFLPSGRAYVKMCDTQAQVTQFWGQYQIDGQGNLTVQVDDGESLAMTLLNGRRKLTWDDSTYTNIQWENQVMQPAGQ